ncbi:hypothetical protein HYPSUDRAFT_1094459 [Hypholoma sublateritium FD-334 SS-4]|uniref:Uncharacterized protein n=1 Tax=Hypholoma sublateritium (strain FD-334 SS-4) TaxID=945553 RepID=A0A0D2NT75_HYPSF|nr:hypothetical protein HYPSUDRAFT_1094459 [Hypholoma sublateritium FD-334 SS-4]
MASYDGQIRAFDYSKNLVSTTMAHTAPITSLCVISSDESIYTVSSSSQDLTAHITQIHLDASTSSKVLASLHLHTSTVSSISSNNTGTHPLTSSWDYLIGLWDINIPAADEVPEPVLNERDRKNCRRIENSTSTRQKVSLLLLKSHVGRDGKPASCGFDSMVRLWNTEYDVCAHTITNSHQTVTGAYDGVVRMWDVRRTKGAVATFRVWEGKQKVLSVDWRRGIMGVGREGGLDGRKVSEGGGVSAVR